MTQAQTGNKVKVHYSGTLDDGTVFDSSREKDPLEFILGQGSVIPGFENAVIGMDEGDTKNFTLSPDEAYGEYRDDLIAVVSKDQLPPSIDPQIGMVLQASAQDGTVTNVLVSNVDESNVTLDGNHPLAGKQLNFEIELVEVD